jgi:hypothetical protein
METKDMYIGKVQTEAAGDSSWTETRTERDEKNVENFFCHWLAAKSTQAHVHRLFRRVATLTFIAFLSYQNKWQHPQSTVNVHT